MTALATNVPPNSSSAGDFSPPNWSSAAQAPPVLTNPSPCGIGLPINDNSCTGNHQFQIDVQNAPGSAMGGDVFLREIRFIIRHEWVADLDMQLRSPSGLIVELSTDNGSGNDHYGNPFLPDCSQYTALLSSAAALACDAPGISSGIAPFIGSYLPEGDLGNFNDGSDPNGLWMLQICDDGASHYGTLEFVELVFEATACLRPTNLTVQQVDSTTALLDWTPGSNCGGTIIEYGAPGFSPGSNFTAGGGTTVFGACPPYLLTGLTPSSLFELTLREHCGGFDFSANACPLQFSTTCSPPPVSLLEDFDSQALCEGTCGVPCEVLGVWRNASNDDFDWTTNAGPTSTSQTGPDDDLPGGGNYLYIETSGSQCRSGNEAMLVSNCILVQDGPDSCDFSFNYHLYGVHAGRIQLHVSTDGGQTWVMLWQVIGNLGDQWRKKFLDLSAYDGMTVQFRFTGRGGSGIRGDLALDNLIFYGSEDLGEGDHLYYVDNDGDGYGLNDAPAFATCVLSTFPGYVNNHADCDDADPDLNPGTPESPCDSIDLNCNGMADEFFLLPPAAMSDTVCSGFPAELSASPSHSGTIYWYETGSGGTALDSGAVFSPSLPLNLTAEPVNHTFFAEEISPNGCVSTERSEVRVLVNPQPDISTSDVPEGCAGLGFDLASLNVTDANSANGTLAYYSAFPFIQANEVSPQVLPSASTTYYLVSTANGGCIDIFPLNYTVLPSPLAEISGDLGICRNGEGTIEVNDIGSGLLPLTFQWNNGSSDTSLAVAAPPLGSPELYVVTITAANGCASTDSAFVQGVTSVDAVQSSVQAVTVCDGNNGSISLTPLDGMAPFTYQWDGGATVSGQAGGHVFANLTQGAYAFTITDSSPQGCEFVMPVIVVNGPSAVVTLDDVDDVRCNGGSDGCIELNVLGNSPTILWSNGATGEVNCGLTAGMYSVTITEGDCVNELSIPVSEPEALWAFPDITPTTCAGENDGALSLNVFGGSPPYQYLWQNGVTVSGIHHLTAGLYDVTVSDSKGCQFILTDTEVTEPSQLSAAMLAFQPVTCYDGADGLIFVSPTGGSAPFTYAWSNGGTGNGIKNLASGSYVVSLSDHNGCQYSQAYFMPQPPPVIVQLQASSPPTCDGIANGSVGISAAGGNGSFSFLWNNGATQEDISGLPGGAYLVTVSDFMGCTASSDSIIIVAPQTIQFAIATQDPTCPGIDNGAVNAVVQGGGTPPYQFNWSTDDSGPTLYALPGGEYCLSVTDANGCISQQCVTLEVNQPMSALVNVVEPACYGTASGQISLNVSGSIQPHNVLWSNGQGGNTISGLTAANYTATITDAIGCQLSLELIELSQPPALKIETDAVESIGCAGGSEGSLDIHPEGGTAPYQFLWSNGAMTEDLGSLSAGFFTVTITDAHNCVSVSQPLQVLSPAPIEPSADLVAPLECQAVEVDSVCVTVIGGIAPYQFLWSHGETAACLVGVASGDYTVTITDAAGCTKELMSVKVPEELSPVAISQLPAGNLSLCAGGTNGELMVQVTGGTLPYQFIWSNGDMGLTSSDTLTLANLTEDSYNLTITDAQGCVKVSDSMRVQQFMPLLANAPGDQVQHVNCKSGSDGSIELNVYGGTQPYFYTWTNANGNVVSNLQDPGNLPAGTYSVLVSDGIGCTAVQDATLNEPLNHLTLLAPSAVVEWVSCFGSADGSIDITPSGGSPPYAYQWSNGAHSQDLDSLPPGSYTVSITDSHLCGLISQPYPIFAPEIPLALDDFVVQDVTCHGGSDGVVDIDLTGGTPPYSYNWSLPSMQEDLLNIPAGSYQVTVLDSNFCLLQLTAIVGQPDEIFIALSSSPATGGQPIGSAVANASGGTAPYTYEWSNGQIGPSISNLLPGWYEVSVTDAHFCTKSEWVEVSNVSALDENAGAGGVSLFPNPTSGRAFLRFAQPLNGTLSLRLTDAQGQRAWLEEREVPASGLLAMEWEGLAAGVYYLTVLRDRAILFRGKVVIE